MARLSREEMKEKLREQRPGYHVVERTASADPARERGAAPDAVSPDLEHPERENRSHGDAAGDFERRLGTRRSHSDATDATTEGTEDDGSTAMLIVPDEADDEDGWAGPKIVIMDPEGKIRSEQG